MKPRPIFLSLLLGACSRAPASRLVVISVDGLRPDYVFDADRYGLKIPELRRMRAEGAFAKVRGVLPTLTYPSHTTMMTGVRPKTHGIYSNLPFDPLGQNHGGWYWYASDIRVPTLFGAVEDAGRVAANFYWPVNVGGRGHYLVPEVWRAGTPDDQKLTRALATPRLVADLEKDLGELPGGLVWNVDADRIRARFAARLLTTKKPDFTTLHLLALDHEQHGRGPAEPEVFAILEQLDAILASLRVAAEGANVCIVSDHGFQSVHTRVGVARAFADAGLLDRDGPFVKDWRATTWSSNGTSAVMLRDPNDRATADRVHALLGELAARPELGIDRILGPAEIDALGGFPNAAYLIAMKPGFAIDDFVDLPVVSPLGPGGHGTHGYLPTEPSMLATFSCAGPGVPKGRDLGVIDMTDFAPSFAKLMQISFPSAEGHSVF